MCKGAQFSHKYYQQKLRGTSIPFEGDTCVETDECVTGSHKCSEKEDCINLPGGYHCSCKLGLWLNVLIKLDVPKLDV